MQNVPIIRSVRIVIAIGIFYVQNKALVQLSACATRPINCHLNVLSNYCKQRAAQQEAEAATSTRSHDVWQYYKRKDGQPKVKCQSCGNIFAYRGGTTNLQNHLMAKHSLLYVSTATGSSQSKPQSQVKLDSMLKRRSVLK